MTESRMAPGLINIFNDEPSGADRYEVFIFLLTPSSFFFLQLNDDDNEAWPTDALPTSLPALSVFDAAFNWRLTSDPNFPSLGGVTGSIESFRIERTIPEPGTLILLGLGLTAFVRRRSCN